MIECPNCKHQNMSGAAFCVECGVTFLSPDPLSTQKMDQDHVVSKERVKEATEPRQSAVLRAMASGDYWLTLHLLDSGEVLPLSNRNEFTIGRVTDGQPVMPDIDLSPYQAYAHGVSRLHAVIKRGVDDVCLVDLDSANGTFVNGKRMAPNEESVISNGDVIALGGLKIQILLKSK